MAAWASFFCIGRIDSGSTTSKTIGLIARKKNIPAKECWGYFQIQCAMGGKPCIKKTVMAKNGKVKIIARSSASSFLSGHHVSVMQMVRPSPLKLSNRPTRKITMKTLKYTLRYGQIFFIDLCEDCAYGSEDSFIPQL